MEKRSLFLDLYGSPIYAGHLLQSGQSGEKVMVVYDTILGLFSVVYPNSGKMISLAHYIELCKSVRPNIVGPIYSRPLASGS